MHQCTACFTVYDATYGDLKAGIVPGTPFEKLPETYCCPVCEAPKEAFKKMVMVLQ